MFLSGMFLSGEAVGLPALSSRMFLSGMFLSGAPAMSMFLRGMFLSGLTSSTMFFKGMFLRGEPSRSMFLRGMFFNGMFLSGAPCSPSSISDLPVSEAGLGHEPGWATLRR